jgi:hypothetical protein
MISYKELNLCIMFLLLGMVIGTFCSVIDPLETNYELLIVLLLLLLVELVYALSILIDHKKTKSLHNIESTNFKEKE